MGADANGHLAASLAPFALYACCESSRVLAVRGDTNRGVRTSSNSGGCVPQTRRLTTMNNGREAAANVQASGLKAVAVVCWQLLNSPATKMCS